MTTVHDRNSNTFQSIEAMAQSLPHSTTTMDHDKDFGNCDEVKETPPNGKEDMVA